MPNTSSHGNGTQSSSSALEVGGNGEEQQKDTKTILGHGWWNKVLDFDEAKKQILFALPMVLNNLFYYMIPLISLMLAGHFGELQLAGATLANSWNVVSGLGVVVTYPFFMFILFMVFYNVFVILAITFDSNTMYENVLDAIHARAVWSYSHGPSFSCVVWCLD
ncbi:hypothetical protein L6164_007676 [Bauhinia variegata]|uniref:Uncharacterized protein n=1 Tax=Bauhinia variegata TaxID=167791 RepID=A0ACB9PFT5_BAUVA|nr:hypothetical protein L6164_007676 [Bauhinia variegata]